MKLRVWHVPKVPMKPFYIDVDSVEQAWGILNVLWDYDLFQYENRIKKNFFRASGLEYFDEEEQEWCEWYDDYDRDIKEHFENLED